MPCQYEQDAAYLLPQLIPRVKPLFTRLDPGFILNKLAPRSSDTSVSFLDHAARIYWISSKALAEHAAP